MAIDVYRCIKRIQGIADCVGRSNTAVIYVVMQGGERFIQCLFIVAGGNTKRCVDGSIVGIECRYVLPFVRHQHISDEVLHPHLLAVCETGRHGRRCNDGVGVKHRNHDTAHRGAGSCAAVTAAGGTNTGGIAGGKSTVVIIGNGLCAYIRGSGSAVIGFVCG